MDFRVLGPVDVVGPDGSVPLGGPKQRAVIAHLLVRANRLITTEGLIDAVWPEEPPDSPKASLRAYISNLRKALGPSRIESRAPGYLLRVDPDEVDALRFEALVRDAHRLSGDPVRTAAVLHDALALWRGPPFADLVDLRSLEGEIARLEELRLQATEDRIAAELAAGRHDELTGELEGVVREHPLRERLWGHLMLARYRAGRQGEALAAFDEARQVLADELGIDPSPELRRLHERILQQDPSLELRGRPLRGYRLLERIGEGAYGVVHRALQPQVGREVAIKSIHPELANDPEFVRRFEREAQLVARLEHPHVVPLYDYWREPDAAYLVMRFLRGGSLRTRLDRDGALAPDEVARLLDQIADALAAAHQQSIVHRDVKPENVLLDEEGRAYLTDFGIAKDLGESRTTRSGALGTPAYLSPEQIRGEPITPAADLYALGVLLYEVVTGRHPFPEGSVATLIQQHLHEPLPSVVSIRPELSSGVDGVIARATAKDAALRFADAPALATAFRAALGTFATTPSRMPALRVANPYKGLRPFDEADAPDFFGRDALISRLLARLNEGGVGSRLLAVVGPSGSGKSSVVSAGLLPALRRGELDGSGDWFYAEMTPGAHPIEELEAALLRVAIDPPTSLIEQLERDELGLLRAVKRILPDDGSELVLFIDQLEELFTLTEDERIRSHALASIAAATADPNSRLRVIATLRADFYDRPLLHPAFGELLAARTEAVTPLAPDELERAIDGPAERVGVAPEPALVAEMVADIADEPGALPLLQYALTELFEQREDRTMTVAAYHEIGGTSGALARRADELFEELDEPGRDACRQLFLHLVALGEGTEDTRRRVTRAELDTLEVDREAMDTVIERFGRHRLLSFDRDPLTRGPTVELAHEAFLRAWSRLRGWIDDARDDVRTRHRLSTAAGEWDGSGREPSFLLSGARLAHFESWSATSALVLARREREYVNESVERRDAEEAAEHERLQRERALERRSVRRMRGLVAVLAVAALVAATLTAVATDQRNEAEHARLETRARELAVAADANLDADPELSVLLALEAVRTTRAVEGEVLREAEEALHRAILELRLERTIDGAGGYVSVRPDGARLVTDGPEGPTVYDVRTGKVVLSLDQQFVGAGGTNSAAFSPDGKRILTAHGDGTAVLWDAESGDGLRLFEQPCERMEGAEKTCYPVMSAVFSPQGDRIATLGPNGTVAVWDLWTRNRRTTIDAFDGEPAAGLYVADLMSFSPDGERLAVVKPIGAKGSGTTAIWDLSTGRASPTLVLSEDFHQDVAFSPDGSLLATVGDDVVLWDAMNGRPLAAFGPECNIYDVEFSAAGDRLATSGCGGEVTIWELTSQPLAAWESMTLRGHTGATQQIDFIPGTTKVATAGSDGTTRIWETDPGGSREQLTLPGPEQWNGDVEFASDGGVLFASASTDGVVEARDASTGELIMTFEGPALGAGTFGVALNPDESRLAAASGDKTVTVWDANTGEVVYTFEGHAGCPGGINRCPVWDVEFSPDGTLLATGSGDGTARILEAASGEELRVLGGHTDFITRIDFSPDGTRLATASWDGTARIWNVETGRNELTVTPTATGLPNIQSVTFSPDGTRFATGGWDGWVRVWDAGSGKLLQEWSANPGGAFDVAFAPDGTTIATPIALWDARTGALRFRLTGAASRLVFSDDGTRLATISSPDDVIRIWVLPVNEVIEQAESRLTRGFTADECRQFRIEPCPA